MIPADLLRMLDANLDRASEGLRVAEDIGRFVLHDAAACQRLRSMRHRLWRAAARIPGCEGRLLDARESETDVGRNAEARARPAGTAQVFRANLHRVQEALRTLEEVFSSFGLDPAPVGELRFEAYDSEKAFYPRLRKRDLERKLDFSLYVLTGPEESLGRGLVEVAQAAIAGGAGAIQLRAREMTRRDLLAAARELRSLTSEPGTTLIVNDHLDVALAAEADGVHLGQQDLPLPEARRISGPDLILGATVHSVDQARRAEEQGATYISLGPIFPSTTWKGPGSATGLDVISRVKPVIQCPLVCTGGITLANVDEVVRAGADRVAVLSAVVGAADIRDAARAFVDRIAGAKREREGSGAPEERNDAVVP